MYVWTTNVYVGNSWLKAKQVRFSFEAGKPNRRVKLLRSECQTLHERPILYSLYEYSGRRSYIEDPINKAPSSTTTTQKV